MANNLLKVNRDSKEGIYRNYFDEMPCFVSIQDHEMHIIDCNKLFKEHFGAKAGEFCYEVYKGRMRKCNDCPVENTFATGQPQQSEEIIINLKGEEIPVQVYTTPLFNGDGEVEYVLEISSDISRVKRIQKKLYAAQRQLQQFFDEVPCYLTVQDRDLKITTTNRRFREDFGSGGGVYCYEMYKHRDEPCLECPVARTFADGRSHQSEEVVTAISGDQYNVLVSTAPLRDDEGQISHVVEMSTNITQVRQLQDQLTSLGLLVGSMSHGIKGLASSLDGGMYMMGSGLERNDRERIDKGWDIVKRNVDRIRSMITDILYYAKDRESEYELTDIYQFMSDVASTMESKAKSFNVDFKYTCEPSLGEFTVDQTAMRSALINILENSFDACRKDLAKPEHQVLFKVEPDEDPNVILIHVNDDGIGMDQETQEKIFSLFFSSKGVEGTGLGLFISNKIIKQHGGMIDVTSKQGEGAHFRIVLPKEPKNK
ncbi:MAG: PAS domain-containing protein [Desulfobacterales bacterium]